MTVKSFLKKFNHGRSSIGKVSLKDVETEVCGLITRDRLFADDYLDWGDCKINSFTIDHDELILYVKR